MGGYTDIPFKYNSALGWTVSNGWFSSGSVGFTYARTRYSSEDLMLRRLCLVHRMEKKKIFT